MEERELMRRSVETWKEAGAPKAWRYGGRAGRRPIIEKTGIEKTGPLHLRIRFREVDFLV